MCTISTQGTGVGSYVRFSLATHHVKAPMPAHLRSPQPGDCIQPSLGTWRAIPKRETMTMATQQYHDAQSMPSPASKSNADMEQSFK